MAMSARRFGLSLGKLLIAVNVGLVFFAVAYLAVAASARLERVADEQALARVQLAGSGAAQEARRAGAEIEISLRLLKEQLRLARAAGDREPDTITSIIERFRQDRHLSGC